MYASYNGGNGSSAVKVYQGEDDIFFDKYVLVGPQSGQKHLILKRGEHEFTFDYQWPAYRFFP